MQFIKLTKGTDAIKIFNNFGFFKLSIESGEEEPDLTPTSALVYTLSDDGTYYIVGTGFTSVNAVYNDESGGTNGSGLDNTWVGGQLVIPAEHNGLPVKAIASRAFNGVKNITEVYIYDGITTIGQRCFQIASEPYDTTMTACRLPETLTGLGGYIYGGRLFWGRQGLQSITIPKTATHLAQSIFGYARVNKGNIILNYASGTFEYVFMQFNNGTDYLTSEVDITINNQSSTVPNSFTNAFQGACLRNLTFNGFTEFTYNNSVTYFQYTFDDAKIQCIRFNDMQIINPGYTTTTFTMTSQRVYFPALRQYGVLISPTANVDNVFFGYSKCTLNNVNNLPSNAKLFIKPEYIDWYNSATNWTTFFVKDGNEETRMFVYGEYASGDTLPTQIGTTQVYNVTWYEDYTLTTPAGSTATANKEYYGTISAVV